MNTTVHENFLSELWLQLRKVAQTPKWLFDLGWRTEILDFRQVKTRQTIGSMSLQIFVYEVALPPKCQHAYEAATRAARGKSMHRMLCSFTMGGGQWQRLIDNVNHWD